MLDRLVSLLPASWQPKAKGLVVALGTIAGLLTLVLGSPDWLTAAIAVLTALGVYQAPNLGYVKPAPGTSGTFSNLPGAADTH